MICGPGGSKSRLAKAAGAEPSGQMRDDKLHAVVARSTFRSQNVQSTTCSCRFWTLKRRFVWQAQGILLPAKRGQNVGIFVAGSTTTTTTLHYTTPHYATLHHTPLHSTPLDSTPLHSTRLHYNYGYSCNYNYIT